MSKTCIVPTAFPLIGQMSRLHMVKHGQIALVTSTYFDIPNTMDCFCVGARSLCCKGPRILAWLSNFHNFRDMFAYQTPFGGGLSQKLVLVCFLAGVCLQFGCLQGLPFHLLCEALSDPTVSIGRFHSMYQIATFFCSLHVRLLHCKMCNLFCCCKLCTLI